MPKAPTLLKVLTPLEVSVAPVTIKMIATLVPFEGLVGPTLFKVCRLGVELTFTVPLMPAKRRGCRAAGRRWWHSELWCQG